MSLGIFWWPIGFGFACHYDTRFRIPKMCAIRLIIRSKSTCICHVYLQTVCIFQFNKQFYVQQAHHDQLTQFHPHHQHRFYTINFASYVIRVFYFVLYNAVVINNFFATVLPSAVHFCFTRIRLLLQKSSGSNIKA